MVSDLKTPPIIWAKNKYFSTETLILLPMETLKACHCCGLVQRVELSDNPQRSCCSRCQTVFDSPETIRKSCARTAAGALGALILFFPAVLLPILQVERLGHRQETSLFWGTMELIAKGDWFVGLIVLVFSLIFPFIKILLLLELSLWEILHKKHKATTYRLMEAFGRWSMLDVMLIALLVMLIKLGDLVTFHFGPAVIAFILCVFMNLYASLSFRPHAIWEADP